MSERSVVQMCNKPTKKKILKFTPLGLRRDGGRYMAYDTDYSTNFSMHLRDYLRRISHIDHVTYVKAKELAGTDREIPFETLNEKEKRMGPVRVRTFLEVLSSSKSGAPTLTERKLPLAISQVM